MRIAVILSGSIRNPESSLASLRYFDGHELSTFIHTWTNVAAIQEDSFSKRLNIEPSDDLLASYSPRLLLTSDWSIFRGEAIERLESWKRQRPEIPSHTDNIGMHGMYHSLWQASAEPLRRIEDFDLLVRLRFDCRLFSSPATLEHEPGWMIPEGNDFFGMNDQLGWFWAYPGDPDRSRREASAYLDVFNQMEELIIGGCVHGPEMVLKANLDRLGVKVQRPRFAYTIH